MEYKDYYKILGVSRDAKPDQIKAAYRKLARKYHPDVSKESDAEARFKEVNEANEVLKDPEKRAQYDALGSGWHAGDPFRPPPGGARPGAGGNYQFSEEEAAQFSDFFSSLFGGLGGGRGSRSSGFGGPGMHADPFAGRGRDQNARLRITIEEAYRGGTRQLRLETPEIDANGQVKMRARTLNVRIPAGVTEGQQIRLAGQGSPSSAAGSAAGDLFLDVEFEPHPLYRSEGKDIHLKLPIAPWEAARGATVPVPTLGGTVSLKIAAGSQSGQRLRLKGRGLPGKPAGDAFVQLEITNPPAETEQARAAFDALAEQFKSFNPRAKLGV
jgi:curved DNA-binding protein